MHTHIESKKPPIHALSYNVLGKTNQKVSDFFYIFEPLRGGYMYDLCYELWGAIPKKLKVLADMSAKALAPPP